jgi:hypothetical protein
VVAARCARDVWAHRCLRDEPWRTEYDSSRDDVACYYQRYFGGASVWYFYFRPNVAEYFRTLANR